MFLVEPYALYITIDWPTLLTQYSVVIGDSRHSTVSEAQSFPALLIIDICQLARSAQ